MRHSFHWPDAVITDAVTTCLRAVELYTPLRSTPPPVMFPGAGTLSTDVLNFMRALVTGRQSLIDASRTWCAQLALAQHDHAELDQALARSLPTHWAVPGAPLT